MSTRTRAKSNITTSIRDEDGTEFAPYERRSRRTLEPGDEPIGTGVVRQIDTVRCAWAAILCLRSAKCHGQTERVRPPKSKDGVPYLRVLHDILQNEIYTEDDQGSRPHSEEWPSSTKRPSASSDTVFLSLTPARSLPTTVTKDTKQEIASHGRASYASTPARALVAWVSSQVCSRV